MSRNKTRILILGSSGMLGHMACNVLLQEKGFQVETTHFNKLEKKFYFDVLDGIEGLKRICVESGPYQYIINCIGVTKKNINENSLDSMLRAVRINALFPYQLCLVALENNAKVIQISTDGVFSGKSGIRKEDAKPECLDLYGWTKAMGEVKAENFLNIRCSIIGPSPYEKGGLFEWLNQQPKGAVVQGYTNHLWNGVTTLQFALLCKAIIKKDAFMSLRKESWIFHFAPNKPVSKYALLLLLKRYLKKDVMIKPVEDKKESVKRLLGTKYRGLKKIFTHDIPMQEAIQQLVDFQQI